MKTIISATLLLIISVTAFSQDAGYISSGLIEFDKTVNMWAARQKTIYKGPYEAQQRASYEQYRKTQPQFKILKSTLAFSKDKTLYTPVKELVMTSSNPLVDQNNTVFSDLVANAIVNQKNVEGDLMLIKEPARKITWKITSEMRDIAGYQCRRANALVMDSIYVVAFYTDDIAVSGGPELFSGLPGMILGVALPRENVTWFATKVTPQTPPAIVPPTKGKATQTKELEATLRSLLKNYPPELAQVYLKALML